MKLGEGLGLHDNECSVCFKTILFPSFGKKSYSWSSLMAMEIGIEGHDDCCCGSGFHDRA